ncbi:MAG: hypothetical protein IIU51_03835, partial [Bacteroidaceae bacterium]|nr:hypothetical protein [Bacteroidaceae bacterium]
IQNWAVQKAVGFASEAAGMDITLDRVGISFPLDIELENLTACLEGDTLLHTGTVVVDMDFSQIFQGQLGVDGIDIKEGRFNSANLIPQMHIGGQLGLLHLDREDTDLKQCMARLSGASLADCHLDISLRDTTIVDTTESAPLPWTILVERIDISNASIAFRMACDTMTVSTEIKKACLTGGDISLRNGVYTIGSLGIDLDTLHLCMMDTAGAKTSIPLSCTSLGAEGLRLDSAAVALQQFHISTATGEEKSTIRGNLQMDFNAFTPKGGGSMATNIRASLAHTDLLSIARDFIPKDLAKAYPTLPLNAHIAARGSIDSISVDTLHLFMPTAMDIQAEGFVADALAESGMRSHLQWDASTMNLNFVRRYMGLSGVNIPRMNLSAETRIHGNKYAADAQLSCGKGKVRAKASIDLDNMAYRAMLNATQLDIRKFLPQDSIGLLSFSAKASGHGTDPLSRATGLRAEVDLHHLEYKEWDVDNARFTAKLRRGKASVELHCDNEILMANACANADINKEVTKADFALSVNKV